MYQKSPISIFWQKKAHSGNYSTRFDANFQPSEDIFNANQALFGQLLKSGYK